MDRVNPVHCSVHTIVLTLSAVTYSVKWDKIIICPLKMCQTARPNSRQWVGSRRCYLPPGTFSEHLCSSPATIQHNLTTSTSFCFAFRHSNWGTIVACILCCLDQTAHSPLMENVFSSKPPMKEFCFEALPGYCLKRSSILCICDAFISLIVVGFKFEVSIVLSF
jgi:hypothetical protein